MAKNITTKQFKPMKSTLGVTIHFLGRFIYTMLKLFLKPFSFC